MKNTVSTTDARRNFTDIVNKVANENESIVLTRKGREIAALISMRELELLRRIEDRIDIEDAEKALAEPGTNIPAEEVWKQLGL